jgi:hypothetical protein
MTGMIMRVNGLEEAVSSLPPPEPAALAATDGRWDLFVGALGFEPRCAEVPTRLAAEGVKVERAVLAEYETNREENRLNYPNVAAAFESCGARTDILGPGLELFGKQLAGILTGRTGESRPRVLLDVSGASNRFVMTAVRALLEADVDLTVVYAEAMRYFPTREDWELNTPVEDPGASLEVGVGELSVTVDLPGYHIETLPDVVVVIAGFGRDRARASIARVDPSLLAVPGDSVEWILGVPHLPEDAWRLEAQVAANAVPPQAVCHEVSTFDYRSTAVTLEKVHLREAGVRQLTVAPLGSKMQALGASLFCWARPEVRVVFAAPVRYRAARYSEGTKAVWQIPLGDTRELRALLDSVDHVVLEPAG